MKPKTIHERIAAVLSRQFNLPKEVHDDDTDHIRIGWFSAGYRRGYNAAQRKIARKK